MVGDVVRYLARFSEQVRERPDHPAVSADGGVTTYAQLGAMVDGIAAALLRHAARERVLLFVPQGAFGYAAMLGCSLAGSTFAPVNVGGAVERQRLIAKRFRPDVVLVGPGLGDAARAVLGGLQATFIDSGQCAPAHAGLEPGMTAAVDPQALAYVMFTSGSTGVPKGVMIGQAALDHYVDWIIDAMQPGPADRWSQHPNLAFDLSVLDIYGALCSGATLHPLTSPSSLLLPAKFIRREQLTIWNSVPSVLTSMLQTRQVTPANFASVRLATFCGEPLRPEHVEALLAANPGMVIHNTYGPTEATVSCTLARLDAGNFRSHCDGTVAIGDAIPGMGVHLVGDGAPDSGEIAITGPQLARGYFDDPVETGRRFRLVPIDGELQRAYVTGDHAVRRDGQVYFRGRIDQQVKVRGERIELDDIAATVARVAGVPALVFLDEAGGVLDAVLEADPLDAAVPPDSQIVAGLADHLGKHLVPRAIVRVDSFARNANDKVDRAATLRLALPQLAAKRARPRPVAGPASLPAAVGADVDERA